MTSLSGWRYQYDVGFYGTCHGIDLGKGILISNSLPLKYGYFENIYFRSLCRDGMPMYSSFVRFEDDSELYPDVWKDWVNYLNGDFYPAGFKYSIYVVVYSVTTNFIIVLFLTVLVYINVPSKLSRKASYVLKTGALLGTLNMLIFLIRVLKQTRADYHFSGVVSSSSFYDLLWIDKVFPTINLVVMLLLEISQVQIVVRFFKRMQEKRLVLFLGVFLSVGSQILWIIPTYIPRSTKDSSVFDILPPFVYLFRIALATSYASIVFFHILLKKHICFRGRMLLLTFLTIFSILSAPALFIFDVANVWMNDLSEIFTTTCYLAATVIVLEWTNRVHTVERKIQAASVLGRPIFEDEEQNFHFARYAIRMQNALSRKSVHSLSNDGDNGIENINYSNVDSDIDNNYKDCDVNVTTIRTASLGCPIEMSENKGDFTLMHSQQGEDNVMRFKKSNTWRNNLSHVLDSFVYYTDRIFMNTLVGSRTVGSSTNDSEQDYKVNRVRKMVRLDAPDDVFVYKKTMIAFESDEEETHPNTTQVGPSSANHV